MKAKSCFGGRGAALRRFVGRCVEEDVEERAGERERFAGVGGEEEGLVVWRWVVRSGAVVVEVALSLPCEGGAGRGAAAVDREGSGRDGGGREGCW